MKTIWKQLLSNTILAFGNVAVQFVKQLINRLAKRKDEDQSPNG